MVRREEPEQPDIFEMVSAIRGDKRTALESIRNRLAIELATARGQSAAAVAKELRATIEALDSIPGGEVSKVDELRAQREKRRTNAAGG